MNGPRLDRSGDGQRRRGHDGSPGARWAPLLLIVGLLVAMLPGLVNAKPRQDPPDRPHRHRDAGAEVVGGIPVPQGSVPYVTAVLIDVGDGVILCGGALIAPRFVVTAAHCTDNDDGTLHRPEQYELVIGQVSRRDPPEANLFGVTAVAVHPDWDAARGDGSDVAVLTLDEAVPPAIAEPVALVASGDAQYERAGQPVAVFGWGRISGDGATSAQLLVAAQTITTDKACDRALSSAYLPATYLCVNHPTASSCNGDSGGPLLIPPAAPAPAAAGRAARQPERSWWERRALTSVAGPAARKGRRPPPLAPLPPEPVLVGLVSFGRIGCPTGVPSAYAQLSAPSIRGFIASVVGQ